MTTTAHTVACCEATDTNPPWSLTYVVGPPEVAVLHLRIGEHVLTMDLREETGRLHAAALHNGLISAIRGSLIRA